MFKRLVGAVLFALAIPAAILVAGFSGVLFRMWPTWTHDQGLEITQATLESLRHLQNVKKFEEDRKHYYPGAPNELVRLQAQGTMDGTVETLVTALPKNPKRSFVLGAIKAALPLYDQMDSEEKDEALVYFQEIMTITGIADSGELLNVWRYGLPYGWLLRG